jgi:hypothetical protein
MMKLNLGTLKCFEIVTNQFQDRGVVFQNAIAIEPSNPAYFSPTSKILLLGNPKQGWLEATFNKPVSAIQCRITSSQRTIMSVHDAQDVLLGRAELEEANLTGSSSSLNANQSLTLEFSAIAKVTFYAFDGQITLSEFSFQK